MNKDEKRGFISLKNRDEKRTINYLVWFGLIWFYATSTIVGYLMTNPVLFQTIQFSISTHFCSIWPIDRTLSGTTTPGQSGPRSDGNKRVLCISQSFSITGDSPSDCFLSYAGHSLEESSFSAQMQLMYSAATADWVRREMILNFRGTNGHVMSKDVFTYSKENDYLSSPCIFFSLTRFFLPMLKDLPYYLLVVVLRNEGYMPSRGGFTWNELQRALSKIWTQFIESIF